MRNQTKFILITSGILFSVSAFAVPPQPNKKCDVLPKPRNVVSVPAFSEGESCPDLPATSEKVQYEGAEEAFPLFREAESTEEFKNGAKYPKSPELYVDPEPDFTLTRENIVEPFQEDELPASDVK